MKRIKSACLIQTLRFGLKEDIPHEEAVQGVKQEYEHYKAGLERSRTRYKITKEETLSDGSIQIEIRKQYNGHDCGSYLD